MGSWGSSVNEAQVSRILAGPSPPEILMARNVVRTPKAAAPPATYSQAVRAGNLVFVSGTPPYDAATGAVVGETIQEQVRQSLTNISAILEAAGSSVDRIVSATVLLVD